MSEQALLDAYFDEQERLSALHEAEWREFQKERIPVRAASVKRERVWRGLKPVFFLPDKWMPLTHREDFHYDARGSFYVGEDKLQDLMGINEFEVWKMVALEKADEREAKQTRKKY